MRFQDLTGQRFGRLTVIGRAENGTGNASRWACRCDCGALRTVYGKSIKNGDTRSCGCLGAEISSRKNRKHGGHGTRLYNIWRSMRARTENKGHQAYSRYGGRGIKVCAEWERDFQAFYDWAMANGYRDDLEIDRKDNDGDYCPENCRWITKKAQQSNRRNNHMITANGDTRTLQQWGEITGLGASVIHQRISHGWTPEEAVTTPLKKRRGHRA